MVAKRYLQKIKIIREETKRMKRILKVFVAMSLAMTMVAGGVATADASTTYRDDWYLNKITPTVSTTTDTVSLKKNDAESYTGVCSNSTSSYDSVAMGGTSVTTITSSVRVYRQAGDVQTVRATTTRSSEKAKFKMTLTCNNGSAVNEGYVYWISNN